MYLPLRAISVFHAAASSGSISRAAAELNVTPSAVSQQIQSLETHLGTALMTKVGRGVALTEAGERYFAMISEEIDRIADATQRIRGLRSVTLLTVRATPTLSTKFLLPRLRSFLDGHPDLEVRLNGTNEMTDFAQEAVDIEIRHGTGQWPGVYVEALTEESFLPVCSPAYCAPSSLDAADLQRHRLIYSIKSQVQWPHWFSVARAAPLDPGQRVLFDRSHMAIDAAVDGMGIALESTLMMWRELRDGTLICPVREPPAIRLTTQWIVCPFEHLHKKKVILFLDWLRAERAAWQSASQLPAAR
ncbi:LysR family transcriptional regulator [Caballeronia terrestris]|jgi:DNA-binding transcriptional LysR family regulator|nr:MULTISPECIES: LysR substrate-binding domain-containing protein [Caballeronia]SAL28581.1 LysR family transcriptional regulator [Caballeronia humi]SAL66606.1 LysR family transcriptional regulator [Caballeronia terrestris]